MNKVINVTIIPNIASGTITYTKHYKTMNNATKTREYTEHLRSSAEDLEHDSYTMCNYNNSNNITNIDYNKFTFSDCLDAVYCLLFEQEYIEVGEWANNYLEYHSDLINSNMHYMMMLLYYSNYCNLNYGGVNL